MECFSTNINVVPTSPDPCDGETKLTSCVVNAPAIPFLQVAAGTTQLEINEALVLALQNALTRIEQLENP